MRKGLANGREKLMIERKHREYEPLSREKRYPTALQIIAAACVIIMLSLFV